MDIKDQDRDIPLLSSLLGSFDHFQDALLYSKKYTVTLREVQMTERSKEFSTVKDLKIDDSSESLSVSRGGSVRRGMLKSKRLDG